MLSHIRPQGPARVLLITDQPVLAKAMALTLDHGAYMARTESDARQAVLALKDWRPHIIVVDLDTKGGISLPNLVQASRSGEARTPIVALSRNTDLKTKLDAFYAGADDVMSLPFDPEELLARVMAVTRRTYQAEPVIKPVIVVDDLRIDIMSRHVQVGGHDVALTPLELSILYLLAANEGNTLSRSAIISHLWGPDYLAESNLIDRHIRNLRIKLNDSSKAPRFIYTVPGEGYRFARPREHRPEPQ